MRKSLILAATAVAALATSSAQAATWNFAYASFGGAPHSATGSITTSDTLNAAGGYDVTGISGQVDGDVISGLIGNPSQPFASLSADGQFIFDNVLYALGAQTLSNPGVLFSSAGGFEYNLFGDGPHVFELYRALPFGGYVANSVGDFRITAGVPEPMAWLLMLSGFAMIGATLRRRAPAAA